MAMRGAVLVTVLAAALAACSAVGGTPDVRPSGGASASPAASPAPSQRPVTAADLSGTWYHATGSAEGSPGPVRECWTQNTLTLRQTGTALSGELQECGGPCPPAVVLTGSNENGTVKLSGSSSLQPERTVVLELRFDAASQHLVGTRDGKPFWAAPLVRQEPCGSPPVF